MKLKLKTGEEIIPMNQLEVGEFAVLIDNCGSEISGVIVWALMKDGEKHFQVVGSKTGNRFFSHVEGRVRRLKTGDVIEVQA